MEGADFTIERDSGAAEFRIFHVSSGGDLTLNNSTISGGALTSRAGAGIYNYGGTVTLNSTTVSGNSVINSYGGGIHNRTASTLNLTDSTISGNSASEGGGIVNNGTLTINNSTVSGNAASFSGGGIFTSGFSASTTLNNTIITNTLSGGDCFNVGGTFAGSNNLIDDHSSGDCSGISSANVTFFDTTLADNGGPTLTHALLADSNAINGGDNALIPPDSGDQDGDTNTTEDVPFDQRGVGFARIINTTVDIGAFEYDSVATRPHRSSGHHRQQRPGTSHGRCQFRSGSNGQRWCDEFDVFAHVRIRLSNWHNARDLHGRGCGRQYGHGFVQRDRGR